MTLDDRLLKPAGWQYDDYKTAKQAILSDLLEIIGEDENSMVEEQYASPQPTVDEHYRNRLRQELRDKVKEYTQ